MLIHNETLWATLHFVLLFPSSCCQMREVVQWLDGWESLIWSRHLIWLCCVTYQQWLPVKSVHAKSNNRRKKSAVCTFVVVFTHPFSGSRSLSCPHELINDCKGGCERRMVVLLQHDLLHLWAQPQFVRVEGDSGKYIASESCGLIKELTFHHAVTSSCSSDTSQAGLSHVTPSFIATNESLQPN